MLLCFIVILFICVVVGVIKYSTAHSLKQEKDIKLSTIDNEKFTMEKYYTDSKPLLIIYFHPECYFCSMEMSEMLEIKRIENFNALFITNALESEVQDFLLQYPIDKGEFYQFNLSSCIRQQNSLTAQFVIFSLSNLANIFYPPQFLQ